MIEEKLGKSVVLFDRFVRVTLPDFSEREVMDDVRAFFEGKETKSYQRALVQVLDSMGSNVNYRERDEKGVAEWLKVKGF